ncbi:MAG: phosphohistidine phosphatase SixA [Methylophilaceae bacterium]|nr:phosphohistidine phosphatase SixA [Methylophilaceae bacterium]
MELILWRHAEAEDTFPDMDRILTAKGHQQAEKMAAWLKSRLPKNTRILVSPAKRTQQTAHALGLNFSTLEAIAPGASAQDVLNAVDWPNAEGCVLVVGHQPTLGMVASLVLTDEIHALSVKKGAIWWLANKPRTLGSQTLLRAVIAPDLVND